MYYSPSEAGDSESNPVESTLLTIACPERCCLRRYHHSAHVLCHVFTCVVWHLSSAHIPTSHSASDPSRRTSSNSGRVRRPCVNHDGSSCKRISLRRQQHKHMCRVLEIQPTEYICSTQTVDPHFPNFPYLDTSVVTHVTRSFYLSSSLVPPTGVFVFTLFV